MLEISDKERLKNVEELFYICSENKRAVQLCGYCTADLGLYFRICKKQLNEYHMNLNATKRPFGHFDDSVGKQCKSRKIM